MATTKVCQKCSVSFETQAHRQSYCQNCRFAGRHGTAICVSCAREFEVKANSSGRYCSRDCFYVTVRTPGRERKPCPICGVVFKPALANGKTCSRQCAAALQRRAIRDCQVCGKPYSSSQKTCGRDCAGILRRTHTSSTCQRCGKEIPFVAARQRMYCSQVCRAAPVGTRRQNPSGYVEIKTNDGWKLEHRAIMEETLGRPLEGAENVHHKNGDRTDNRPENLELWKRKQLQGVRAKDYHCAGCNCFKEPLAALLITS